MKAPTNLFSQNLLQKPLIFASDFIARYCSGARYRTSVERVIPMTRSTYVRDWAAGQVARGATTANATCERAITN